jgi:GH15 family glucan-1,4-alpha-glucosidase
MIRTVNAIQDELEEDGLIRRYSAESDGMPGEEGTFLACTFWIAECLALQGRTDDARKSFERACKTANDLGLFAEEFDPAAGRMLGNFPQALTHLSLIQAAVAIADGSRDRRKKRS